LLVDGDQSLLTNQNKLWRWLQIWWCSYSQNKCEPTKKKWRWWSNYL